MNEELRLHKELSIAEVEYQQKFDVVKLFEEGLLMPNKIADPEKTLKEWERLKAEELVAYEKRDMARKAYAEYLRKQHKKSR